MAAQEDRPETGNGPHDRNAPPQRGGEWWRRSVAFYLGAMLLMFTAVVWLVTNRIEPAFVGASVTLLITGAGQDALREFKREQSTDGS